MQVLARLTASSFVTLIGQYILRIPRRHSCRNVFIFVSSLLNITPSLTAMTFVILMLILSWPDLSQLVECSSSSLGDSVCRTWIFLPRVVRATHLFYALSIYYFGDVVVSMILVSLSSWVCRWSSGPFLSYSHTSVSLQTRARSSPKSWSSSMVEIFELPDSCPFKADCPPHHPVDHVPITRSPTCCNRFLALDFT